jgi:hypothetical protein
MWVSCEKSPTNIADVAGKYIKHNKLPISIGEEIIVNHDFDLTEKIKFQIFMLDLTDKLSNDISEGNYNDKTIENLIEAQRILTGFYDYCRDNNYELAIIFNNKYNEKDLLIDYLKYNNCNLNFYNNWIIFDNNTRYTALKSLMGVLLQMGDIAMDNIKYFLRGWEGEDDNFYKNVVFIDGQIETIEVDYNENFDIVMEVDRMTISYYLISDIIYLFKIKGYNLDEYENIWEHITEKNKEFEKLIDRFNNSNK